MTWFSNNSFYRPLTNAEVGFDDTDYIQGLLDRGEPIPPGYYRIIRPLVVPDGWTHG